MADTSTASTSTGADPRTRSPVQDRQATIVSATDHLDVKNPDLGRIPKLDPSTGARLIPDARRTDISAVERIAPDLELADEGDERATPCEVLLHAALVRDCTRFTRQDGVCGDVAGHAALARCATTRRRVPARFLGPAEADELTAEYDGRHGPWVAS